MAVGAIALRAALAPLVVALALTGVLALPAAAAQQSPPGWQDPGSNEWVAFTLDTYAPAPIDRTTFAPVTLTRTSRNPVQTSWFTNWDVLDPDPLVTGDELYRWPLDWIDGTGIQLHRVDECLYTDTSCRYDVVAGNGQEFWFFGGTPPTPDPVTGLDPITGQTVPDPNSYAGNFLNVTPLPTITLGPLGAVGVAGSGGGAGSIRLNAPGTVDGLPGTVLTYQWTLVHVDTGTTYDSGPVAADFFQPTVQHDGAYCVQLTVTASDGHSVATPTCASGTGALFNITGVAPPPAPPPVVAPPPAPVVAPPPDDAGSGGGGGAGGGGLPALAFANPASRTPSVLSGGGGGNASPTVVWLWKPEWYQPEPEVEARPQTSGQPVLTERRDIVVTGGSPRGSNAGPWLASLGIAGLLGGGWLLSRRRRMRMLAEL